MILNFAWNVTQMNFFESISNRLPQWALTLIAITLLGYAGVLGGVAILSERDVKFWPPEIGPGPKSKMVEELKRFNTDIDKSIDELLNQRKKLSENLQVARSGMANARAQSRILEATTWKDNADKIQDEIKSIDDRLIPKMEDAKIEIRQVETKIKG